MSDKDFDDLNLRSPLAKRKKLADQRGSSGLRQEVELRDEQSKSFDQATTSTAPVKESTEGEDRASECGDGASSIGSEEDFLAAELEAEIG
jgi:hypothetical protein